MRFDKRFQPWLAASPDDSRPIFRCLNIERTEGNHGVAVAADGFVLAVVPVTLDDGDVPGLIRVESMQHAAKLDGRVLLGEDRLRFPKEDSDYPRGTSNYGQFPNWRQIAPKIKTYPVTPPFAVNPAYIDRLWKALGRPHGLAFTAIKGKDGNSPLILEDLAALPNADGVPVPPFGIVMPIQVGSAFVRTKAARIASVAA